MMSPSEIALWGRTGSRTAQLTQTSVIFSVIESPFRDARPMRASTINQPFLKWVRLFHFIEAEFGDALDAGILDAILIGRRTHKQNDDAFERAVARLGERVDD